MNMTHCNTEDIIKLKEKFLNAFNTHLCCVMCVWINSLIIKDFKII